MSTRDERTRLTWRALVLFHAGAVALDATERWAHPSLAMTWLAAGALMAAVPERMLRLLVVPWLLASSVPLLLWAPELANHRNLTLYVNALLLVGWGGACWRARRPTGFDARAVDAVAPALRASVVVVYLFAGFHKLNADFLTQPEVSCAGWFVDKLAGQWLGVTPLMPGWLVVALASCVVAVELGLAIALSVRSEGALRRRALTVAFALHAALALAVFYDFSALMFALLWLFVPAPLLDGDPRLERRLAQALGLVLAAGAGAGGLLWLSGSAERFVHPLQGGALVLAVLHCAVPLWRRWRQRTFQPVSQALPRMPRGLWAAPALLALFAGSNYLGLRTAGTFSMFSNLRTEAGRSNHLLIPADHPLVLWDFQRDVVWVEALDERARARGEVAVGEGLPRVEWVKHLRRWQGSGLTGVKAVLREADGVQHAYDDLTEHAALGPQPSGPWASRLLDFRPVQPSAEAPNRCRW